MPSDSVIKWIIAGMVVIGVTIIGAMVALAIVGKPGIPELASSLVLLIGAYLGGQLFFGHVATVQRLTATNASLAATLAPNAAPITPTDASGSSASGDVSATSMATTTEQPGTAMPA